MRVSPVTPAHKHLFSRSSTLFHTTCCNHNNPFLNTSTTAQSDVRAAETDTLLHILYCSAHHNQVDLGATYIYITYPGVGIAQHSLSMQAYLLYSSQVYTVRVCGNEKPPGVSWLGAIKDRHMQHSKHKVIAYRCT